jgi:hypothetical protein
MILSRSATGCYRVVARLPSAYSFAAILILNRLIFLPASRDHSFFRRGHLLAFLSVQRAAPMCSHQLVKAALVYFSLVFGAGFVLGTIRVLWLVPAVGTRAAELLEMPGMLAVIILSARWVTRHFGVPYTASSRLGMGGMALALILLLDFTAVLWIRGLSFGQYIESFDSVAGTAYLVMLGVLAIMPLLVARRKPPEILGSVR